ncbi:peptidoglycan DD-metalloendopeptidase family protein [Vibrio sp. HA2012]|uniref:peptidoglycan DD-metalloendopeptidase family protein n=1 Tax=Vibrio sp. HA2012 TaxID=1971595 RepID=UPI00269B7511
MKMQIKTALVCAGLSALLLGCSAHFPAPVSSLNKDYSQIERGSYRGSYYDVRQGDTLYYIAYITDKDVNELIRYNHLSAPYTIQPGQKLRLWRPAYKAPAYGGSGGSTAGRGTSSSSAATASPAVSAAKSTTKTASRSTSQNSTSNKKPVVNKVDQTKSKEYLASKQNVKKNVKQTKPDTARVSSAGTKVDNWLWPAKGRVIRKFSSGDQGNKGIDIAGRRGQSVVSTAGGTVVYSGSALRGYGNLIIVKHNDNYLSAYAHNDSLLVKEGQSVKAGQKIATMGSSGANRVKLHFEIRYQGKSVNPQRYLP